MLVPGGLLAPLRVVADTRLLAVVILIGVRTRTLLSGSPSWICFCGSFCGSADFTVAAVIAIGARIHSLSVSLSVSLSWICFFGSFCGSFVVIVVIVVIVVTRGVESVPV
jgi:hypothetical protein